MKVLAYKVGQEPVVMEIENSLTALQEFVGGYIEVVSISHQDLKYTYLLICNEEGKLYNLPPNRWLHDENGDAIDLLCGDFLICKAQEDDFTGLEDDDIEAVNYIECIGGIIIC